MILTFVTRFYQFRVGAGVQKRSAIIHDTGCHKIKGRIQGVSMVTARRKTPRLLLWGTGTISGRGYNIKLSKTYVMDWSKSISIQKKC